MHEYYNKINLLDRTFYPEDLNQTRNIACVVAVSDPYIEIALQNLFRLESWDVCILTDKPERFGDYFYIEKYESAIFSLCDKISFSLRMASKFRHGVTLIDADELMYVKQHFRDSHQKYTNFICKGTSVVCNTILNGTNLGKNLRPHIELLNLGENEYIHALDEKVIYIPYNEKLVDVRYYMDLVRPSIDHATIWDVTKGMHLGRGEGAGLAIAIKRAGLEVNFYEDDPLIPQEMDILDN
jgi:hypothetical protein